MRRAAWAWTMTAGMLLAGVPAAANAQVSLEIGLFFELGHDGWHAYRPADFHHARHAPVREVVFHTPRRAVRIPPGHMPPPGWCRVWYPGVPPGRQPAARPCEVLFRAHRHAGTIIIGTPRLMGSVVLVDGRYRSRDRYDDRYDDRRRNRRDRHDDRRDRGRRPGEPAYRFGDDRDFRWDDDRDYRLVEDDRGFRLVAVARR